MSMVGFAVVYVFINARKLKYLKVISLVVFLRFFYTLILKPLNSGFEPKRGKFMVYARKALIHAGLLDTMVTQSYLDNLIETCPQITRNQFGRNPTWVRIPLSPPYIRTLILIPKVLSLAFFSFLYISSNNKFTLIKSHKIILRCQYKKENIIYLDTGKSMVWYY